MAEILAEAHLHSIGVRKEQINEFTTARDQLLRTLASESGRQSPMAVARALEEARNNPDMLEDRLCAAFASLGFDCRRIGGKGKADGIAVAPLSADDQGNARQYSVSLEAKSLLAVEQESVAVDKRPQQVLRPGGAAWPLLDIGQR